MAELIAENKINTIIGPNKKRLAIELLKPRTVYITNHGFDINLVKMIRGKSFLEELFVIKVSNEEEILEAFKAIEIGRE